MSSISTEVALTETVLLTGDEPFKCVQMHTDCCKVGLFFCLRHFSSTTHTELFELRYMQLLFQVINVKKLQNVNPTLHFVFSNPSCYIYKKHSNVTHSSFHIGMFFYLFVLKVLVSRKRFM